MKRSNRLVLLVGVFLAVVAFVGILLLVRTPSEGPATIPTTGPVVVASADIPLSTLILAEQVTVKTVPLTAVTPGAFTDPSQVIGKIARQAVKTGGQVTAATLNGGASGEVTSIDCPATLRCMSIQVDQVSGVGTVIKTGDYVDMVVGFTADKFPVITLNPNDSSFTVVSGINGTSVKLLLQAMQVLGTLLPPPPAQAQDQNAPQPSQGAGGGTATALNGQQQIVILAVTAQQSEIIKFAQLDGSMSLVLRSPDDFIDPTTKAPVAPVPDETTGIILKTLVDTYGVLPPELVETVLPAQGRP